MNETGESRPTPSGFVSLTSIGMAMVLSLSLLALYSFQALPALLAGWLVSSVQALAASLVYRHVLGPHRRFMWWVMGSLAVRTAFLLAALLVVKKTNVFDISSFASAMIVSYMFLLFAEVSRLVARSSAQDQRENTKTPT